MSLPTHEYREERVFTDCNDLRQEIVSRMDKLVEGYPVDTERMKMFIKGPLYCDFSGMGHVKVREDNTMPFRNFIFRRQEYLVSSSKPVSNWLASPKFVVWNYYTK